MRETKVFTSSVDRTAEPYPFELEVKDAHTGEVLRKEAFRARGDIGDANAIFMLEAVSTFIEVEGEKKQIADLGALLRFFEKVLLDDGYTRLRYLLVDDTEAGVEMDTLGDIISWLIEEYGGRPTQPSGNSSPGRPSAGPTSTAQPSSTPIST